MKFFNTAAPVNCDDHYCLDPLQRIDIDNILMLFTQKNISFFTPPTNR